MIKTYFYHPIAIPNKRFGYLLSPILLFLTLNNIQAQYNVDIGTLEKHQLSNRTIHVWLPENYPNDAPYASIYMHDGQMLFDSTKTWNGQAWMAHASIQKLMNTNKIRPTIIIGINNAGANRHAEYFPQDVFESFSIDTQNALYDLVRNHGSKAKTLLFADSVYSNKYADFLANDLRTYINKRYQTDTSLESTIVAGSSMGGLISWYTLCKYPEIFGAAICMSTHWPGTFQVKNNPIPDAFLEYLGKHLPLEGKHRLWFDHGTETLDALYPPYEARLEKLCFEDLGLSKSKIKIKEFYGEAHTEDAWMRRFNQPLFWLLNKTQE